MRGDIDVDDPRTLMCEQHEDEQHAPGEGECREEIYRTGLSGRHEQV
jgi:hypothetical protein